MHHFVSVWNYSSKLPQGKALSSFNLKELIGSASPSLPKGKVKKQFIF